MKKILLLMALVLLTGTAYAKTFKLKDRRIMTITRGAGATARHVEPEPSACIVRPPCSVGTPCGSNSDCVNELNAEAAYTGNYGCRCKVGYYSSTGKNCS